MAIIELPDGAVKYIKAQRCALQASKLAKPQTHIDSWIKSCQDEAAWLTDNIPMRGTLLDIGCGLGGIDVLLAPKFDHMYLLDGTGWDRRRAAYQNESEPWNSLDLTREVMELNGVSDKTTLIHYKERPRISVDVIISTASWCYHYPVDEYLEWVVSIIKDGGHLCVDLRFNDDVKVGYFDAFHKIAKSGFNAFDKNMKLIKWDGRWKGMRVVFVKV